MAGKRLAKGILLPNSPTFSHFKNFLRMVFLYKYDEKSYIYKSIYHLYIMHWSMICVSVHIIQYFASPIPHVDGIPPLSCKHNPASQMVTSEIALPHSWYQITSALQSKGGMIPLFLIHLIRTKYRGKNFMDTDSDTDANPYGSYIMSFDSTLLST